ncbi:MAG: metallophosphoesterase [Chloroflexia bacterium]|nr:metallophosphoesterase [Chloroflexia bacterium]
MTNPSDSISGHWLGYLYLILPSLLLLLVSLWTMHRRRSPEGIRRPGRWAIAATLSFILLDSGMLAALPRLELSFGPLAFPLGSLLLLRLSLCLLHMLATSLWRRRRSPSNPPRLGGLALLWLLHLALTAVLVDALYVEPFAVQVTELELNAPGLRGDRPLRVLHLTDPHVERTTKREREVLELAQSLRPDLIVLTGDYLNINNLSDPIAQRDARDFLSQLAAPLGVYAVGGTVESPERVRILFEGLDIVFLDDQVWPLGENGLYIVGVDNPNWGREWERDQAALHRLMASVPEDAYSLLLYHTPDLARVAAEEGVNLYLAGHTHGGQVCLPFYGAIVTASRFGKQYEAGHYVLGQTHLYVSRGLGMEGFEVTPRVRFFCPPEVVLLTLVPEAAP